MNRSQGQTPVALIPPATQRLWGLPAVVNFGLGGLGAGAYVIAALAAGFGPSPPLTVASWLGPALVLAGFLAVAGEAGRPLRGVRVLARVATSWMSRELWLGGAFIALVALDLMAPSAAVKTLAAVAAALFAVAQGFILRRARAMAAWDVSVMPVVFLLSALASGMGALLVVGVVTGQAGASAPLGSTLAVVTVGLVVWLAYLTWSRDGAFLAATASLRDATSGIVVAGGGFVAPFALAAAALTVPALAPAAQAAAGTLMVVAQLYTKWMLVVRAGQMRPVTIPHLALQRRPS